MMLSLICLLIAFSGGHPGISVGDAVVGVAAKGMSSAAFFRITNNSAEADTLYAVRADFAGAASLHESYRKDGMVGMHPIKYVVIPPESGFVFKHGGYHVMFMNLKRDLAAGDTVELTLLFRRAGAVKTKAQVRR